MNAVDQDTVTNADGGQIGMGRVRRILKWLGANITITGSGSATYTMPASTSTLASLELNEQLSLKTLVTPTIASFVNATHTHASAAQGGTLLLTNITTADYDTTTNNQENVTNLSFAVGASEEWFFVCYFSSISLTTNQGIKTNLTLPASATADYGIWEGTTTTTALRQEHVADTAQTAAAASTSTTVDAPHIMVGSVTTAGTAGTVQVQIQKLTANNARVYAGAAIIAVKIV